MNLTDNAETTFAWQTVAVASFLALAWVYFLFPSTVPSPLLRPFQRPAVRAGLSLLGLAPLQRVAERVSDRAMPRVRDTEEYRLVRRREVYRAAVEGALADGEVTAKERGMLATLQDELGLSPRRRRSPWNARRPSRPRDRWVALRRAGRVGPTAIP